MDPLAVSAEPIIKIETVENLEVSLGTNDIEWSSTDVVEVEVDTEEYEELLQELATIPGIQTEVFQDSSQSMKILSVKEVIRKAEGFISEDEDDAAANEPFDDNDNDDYVPDGEEKEVEEPVKQPVKIKLRRSSTIKAEHKKEPSDEYEEPIEFDLPDENAHYSSDDNFEITREEDLVNELNRAADEEHVEEDDKEQTVKTLEKDVNESNADETKLAKLELVKLPKGVFRLVKRCDYAKLAPLIEKQGLMEKYRDSKAPVELAKDKIMCNLCFRTVQTWKSYRRHMKEYHFRANQSNCEYCDFIGGTIQSLRSHIQTVHLNQRRYSCPKCEVTIKERRRFVKHLATAHDATEQEIEEIMQVLAPPADKKAKYICPHCNSEFPTRNRLLRHVEFEHDINLETYKCKLCLTVYLTEETLDSHTCTVKTKIVLELKKYAKNSGENKECPECKETTFEDFAALETHFFELHALNCEITKEYRKARRKKSDASYDGTYVKQEPILCHLCPFFANSKGILQAHVRAEHTYKALKRKLDEDGVPVDMKRQMLSATPVIPNSERIQSVIKKPIVYPRDSDKSADSMKSYCIYCTYGPCSYKRIKWHIGHMHPDQWRYFCPVCRIGLEDNEVCGQHLREKHHELFKSYFCEVEGCSYWSFVPFERKQHNNRVHLKYQNVDETQYKCEQCDFISYKKYDTVHHIKTVHSKVWPLNCYLCFANGTRMGFVDKQRLFRHFKWRHDMSPDEVDQPEIWKKIKNPPVIPDLDEQNQKEVLDQFTKNGSTYVLCQNKKWKKIENCKSLKKSKQKKAKVRKEKEQNLETSSDNIIVQVVKWATPTKEKVTTIQNVVITEPLSPNATIVAIVD